MTFTQKEEYHHVKRPEQVKPNDNLKVEGEFYTPNKTAFRPAERPIQKKPKDNLKPEGEFYKRTDRSETDSTTVTETIRRETPKRPVDNLKLEGSMTVTRRDDYINTANKTIDRTQRTQKINHNSSSITLGSDTTIRKTTNQMNYVSGKDAIKQVDSNSQNPVDGLIVVSTTKVTTVVGGRHKKEPETEYVKRPAKINVIENVAKNTTTTNIENTQNIHKETTSMQRNHNLVQNAALTSENIAFESNRRHLSNNITGDVSSRVVSGETISNTVSGDSSSNRVVSGRNVTSSVTEDSTSRVVSGRNVSSNIIGESTTRMVSGRNVSNNITGDTTSRVLSGSTTGHNISDDSTSRVVSGGRNSSNNIVTGNTSSHVTTSKHFHHRKSEFSSEADVSNTVFHRKNVTSDSNAVNGSLTSNGKMQRKSILNLHEQPSSTTTHGGERQSYSSIHRQNRDSDANSALTTERRTCNVHKENREHNVKNSSSSSMSRIISGGATGTELNRSNVERSTVTRTQVSGGGIDFPSQSHSHS